jgi:3-oxoacyl-[acyl-carrier protein] reductase
MTLALALEYASRNVLINCVAPGFTDTNLTRRTLSEYERSGINANVPIGRMATVEEIAKFILWLGSGENTYIAGQNIAIDGAFSRAG